MQTDKTNFVLSNRLYDFSKRLVQVILPAFGALYFSLGNLWGFPYTEEVVGTCAILATFVGAVVGISSKQYNANDGVFDGVLHASENPEGTVVLTLDFDGLPVNITDQKILKLRVENENQNKDSTVVQAS